MYETAVVPRGDPSEMLELVEASLNQVALLIGLEIVGDAKLRVGLQGITASAPRSAIVWRSALLSYALSASTRRGKRPFRSPAACGASPDWPGVMMNRNLEAIESLERHAHGEYAFVDQKLASLTIQLVGAEALSGIFSFSARLARIASIRPTATAALSLLSARI